MKDYHYNGPQMPLYDVYRDTIANQVAKHLRFLLGAVNGTLLSEKENVLRLKDAFTTFILTGKNRPLPIKIKAVPIHTKNTNDILKYTLYDFLFVQNNFAPLTVDNLAQFLIDNVDYYAEKTLEQTKKNMKRRPIYYSRLKKTFEKAFDLNDDYYDEAS